MPPSNVAVLAHLVGFLIGAALYAMLFALVARRRVRIGEPPTEVGDDRLPLLTAILGLIWNLTGLAAYGIRDFAGREPHPMLIATAYSALGFLPAVVVHSVLRSQSRAEARRAAAVFTWAAYAVSTIAAVLLFRSTSVLALQILTWSYALLTIPVLFLTVRSRAAPRDWSIVALAVFAVSALHLSHAEAGNESWLMEAIGHHASILLIFAILYLDFRFALADLFLKRAISLFALVAIAAGLYVGVEIPVLSQHDFRTDPVAVGISVIIWVLLALSYPILQRLAASIVDRLVLRRADYTLLRDSVGRQVSNAGSESGVLDALTETLRAPLSADRIVWNDAAAPAEPTDMKVVVPTSELPRYAITIGPLAAGRRLLSDESAVLHDVALIAARRIDALRLSRERYEQSLREQEISKLATEAELRALRAQVNPHFLFNALNTIGYLIQTAPSRAHDTLMKLTALLRGVLRTGDGLNMLGDEIDLVTAYLDIELVRFEERLHVTIDVSADLRELRVPPLILQPLVENAIKHGIARSRNGGEITISATLVGESISIKVRNTGASTTELEIAHGRRRGVGLANLDERLRKYHSGAHLSLRATARETVVEVTVPVLADQRQTLAGA